jgi:hypothetical protein
MGMHVKVQRVVGKAQRLKRPSKQASKQASVPLRSNTTCYMACTNGKSVNLPDMVWAHCSEQNVFNDLASASNSNKQIPSSQTFL